jgi:catechol 2,3-dioxygenase-like lactoylglutathione lyase family enzyme
MHHVALKTEPQQMRAVLARLEQCHILYSMHGTPDVGSIYVRDPDDILIELTTGY